MLIIIVSHLKEIAVIDICLHFNYFSVNVEILNLY